MAPPAATLTLRDEQRRAVDHLGGVVLRGTARSGKTTAALARWERLVAGGTDPGRILVLCRNAAGAQRFRSRLLAERLPGRGVLAVTTPWALAFEVLGRTRPMVNLAGSARRRALIAEQAAALSADDRPRLSPAGVTTALIDELADLALAVDPSALPDAVSVAAAHDHGDRWEAVRPLLDGYHRALDELGLVDPATLLAHAAAELAAGVGSEASAEAGSPTAGSPTAGSLAAGYDAVIADDLDLHRTRWGSPASLLDALLATISDYLITTDPLGMAPATAGGADVITLPDPAGPAIRRALACHHPAIEGDAAASVVLDALAAGHTPDDIVVVCRRTARAGRLARALARHGIPVAPPSQVSADDPHVRGLFAMLRWVADANAHDALAELVASPLAALDGDARRDLGASAADLDPAHPALAHLAAARERLAAMAGRVDVGRLAHAAFAELGRQLVPGPGPITDAARERALDSCVAFVDALITECDLDPGLSLGRYLAGAAREHPELGDVRRRRDDAPGTVRIASPEELRDHSWPVVVLCGAVEGELPRITAGVRYFDRAIIDAASANGDATPIPDPATRRAGALRAERQLFGDICARATAEVVAVAPTEPGVLMSRFLAGWPCERAALAPVVAPAVEALAPTDSGVPLHPGDGGLRLSASQLDTYAECPRRYLYEYPLRVRGDANVWADFGSLVHDVLEAFIGRDADEDDHSWERLVALAEDHWHDDLAEYRPQREELRRDLLDLLERWWEAEGSQIGDTLEVLAAERSFSIDVAGHTVNGRIDRVDRADDGVGIRILDYKTSKRAKRPAEMADDLQLRMYHLAALRDPELSALGPPTQLRLLFLREMKALDQEIQPDHETVSEALVAEMAGQILAEAFEPRAGDHCRRCGVRRLCPLWPEGRDSGAST